MRTRNTPTIGTRYWIAISAASVFGANLGDFVSHDLGLGHWRGLPVLAALFGLVLVAEARALRPSEGWYWTAIVLLRTGATNAADLLTHDFRLSTPGCVAVIGALLLGGLARSSNPARSVRGLPDTDGWYWASMFLAGTLGTVIGDGVAGRHGLGLGTTIGTAILAFATSVPLGLRAAFGWRGRGSYWSAIVGIRSAGTTAGDWIAADAVFGLAFATLLSGSCLVLCLRAARTGRGEAPGSAGLSLRDTG